MAGDQLEVLKALDVAKIQLYHFTTFFITGMGFFTGAYNLNSISLVTKLLGRLYYFDQDSSRPGRLPPAVSASISGVAFVGTLLGQLFFGWLGDKMGRKKVYGLTLIIMVVFSVASGFSFGSKPKSIMVSLCFFRFWLGFGVGGVYPLSATIMSEYANKKSRGTFIAAVFAMQGFGILVSGIISLIVSTSFDHAYKSEPFEIDPVGSTVPEAAYVWRIVLIFGAFPAALTFYLNMKMPETARYTALVAKDAKQAVQDMGRVLHVQMEVEEDKARMLNPSQSINDNSFGLFSRKFVRRHGLHLFGITSTCFLLNIALYSQTLLQKYVIMLVGFDKNQKIETMNVVDKFWQIIGIPPAKTMNAVEEVWRISKAQTLIALCSTIPGYWFTVALVDIMGRFAIQMMGFFFMTVFMFAIALPLNHWIRVENRIGFLVLYSLTFFFANFGPNATTFILSAEIFPARLRSTCHGISAAAGTAGAIVGAYGFLYAAQSKDPNKTDIGYPPGIGVKNSLFIVGGINFLGMLCTFFVPEPKGKSLEEATQEISEDRDDIVIV